MDGLLKTWEFFQILRFQKNVVDRFNPSKHLIWKQKSVFHFVHSIDNLKKFSFFYFPFWAISGQRNMRKSFTICITAHNYFIGCIKSSNLIKKMNVLRIAWTHFSVFSHLQISLQNHNIFLKSDFAQIVPKI